jgi:hypothetical protein
VLRGDLHGKIAVFAGPSAPARLRNPDPRLVWLEPARAGDGIALAARTPDAVVLLDGVFDELPSIRHKELLMLLGQGARLFGAASMGALRAAELHPFGMIGVGHIFRAYASGRLVGDDEVAVAHAPAELDWRPLSEPLVNIRATLLKAVRRGIVPAAQARALLQLARRVFYRERTWAAVIYRAEGHPTLGGVDLKAFELWVALEAVDLKRIDACEAIQAALHATSRPFLPRPMPPATVFTAALAGQLPAAALRA